jgi:hypothetical protein
MSECKTGDLSGSLNPASSKMMRGQLGPWVKHVRECRIGEYVIDTPAEGGHGEIMVGRNGNPVFGISSGGTTTVVDSSGTRVIFESTRGEKGTHHVSFATHDGITNSWVDNFDIEGDGNVDFRTTETPDGKTKKEVSVEQQWLEVVQRGDRTGVILDGEFMTAGAAREKIAARRKAEASK